MERNFFLDFENKNDFIKKCYLTLFFSGLSKKAPGTIGTLVAMPFGFLVGSYSLSTLFLLALLLSVFAIRIIDSYEQNGLSHDRKEIVIDELAGVWITISMLGLSVISLILSFVLFRIFDIWKPSIINRVDKNIKGGLGVVGDDLLAGFFTGLLGLIILKAIEYIIGIDNYLLRTLTLF